MIPVFEFLREAGSFIQFYPNLAKIIGHNETLLVCYLMRWTREETDWVYRSAAQVEDDTALSPYQQREARKRLKDLGVLEERTREDNSLEYQIQAEALEKVWIRFAEKRKGLVKKLEEGGQETAIGGSRNLSSVPVARAREKELEKQQENKGFGDSRSFEKECAVQLAVIVWNTFEVKIKAGDLEAKHFANLQRYDGVTKERIRNVLTWFHDHAKDKYVPVVSTAKEFRFKFIKLEQAMNKDRDKGLEYIPEPLTPEEVEIFDSIIEGAHWNQLSKDLLPGLIRSSVAYLKEWLIAFRLAFDKIPRRSDSDLALTMRLIDSMVQAYPDEIARWFVNIACQNKNWKDWSGNISKLDINSDTWLTHWLNEGARQGYDSKDIREAFAYVEKFRQ